MSREKDIGCIPEASSNADAATPKSAAPDKLSLSLGAICTPLVEQYAKQGLVIPPEQAARHQAWSDAVSTLRVQGFITWSAAQKAYDKVSKAIWRDLRHALSDTPTPEGGAGNGTASNADASQALRDEHQTATGEKG